MEEAKKPKRAKYRVAGERLLTLGIPEMREMVQWMADQVDGDDVLHALRRVLRSELGQKRIGQDEEG